MKKLLLTILVIVSVALVTREVHAQAASATWALSSVTTTSVATSGNVSGTVETFSSMVVNSYTGPNSSQRLTTPDNSWPGESDQNESRYVQFAVSPDATYEFNVTSVTMNLGAAGGSNMRANIWYSTDPTFTTRTKLNSSVLVLPNGSMLSPSPNYTLDVTVAGGETFYLRVYGWYTSSSTQKYVCPQDVVVSGTTAIASANIITSETSLGSFQHVIGTPSGSQSYSVSGVSLVDDVVVTPPVGFEISTNGGTTWNGNASPVALAVVGGEIAGQPVSVSVRMNSASAGLFSGNIAHASVGVPTKDVAVDGVTLPLEPTMQSTISFGTITGSSILVNFTGGNGERRIVAARLDAAVTFIPTDGSPASGVNSDFTAATDQGGGNRIVYDGTGAGVTVTNLQSNTAYHFAVYEYNIGSGNSQNYNTTNPGTGSQTTLAVPTIAVSPASLSFGAVLINTTSVEKTFTVSGNTLSPATGDITITAPSGFEVSSTSGSGFGSSVQVAYAGGTLSSTTVYVRFKPTAAQSYAGDITNEGGSAAIRNVAVSGTGATPPQPNEFQAEDGVLSAAYVRTQYNGYTGSGYVDIADKINAALEIVFRRASAASDTVRVFYANGGTNRAYAVTLNGASVTFPTFTSTGSWTTWSSVAAVVPLQAGINRLIFRSTTNGGNANLDRIVIGGQTATPMYKLNLTKSGEGSVVASPAHADSLYDAGTEVTLTATPSGGHIFHRWGGTAEGTTNPMNVVMNSHKTQIGVMIPSGGFGSFPYQDAPAGFASVGAYEYPNGTTGGAGQDMQTVFATNSSDLNEWMLRRVDANRTLNFPPLTVYVIGTLTPSATVSDMMDVKDTYDISIICLGTDATISGFGIKMTRAKNIIVRNIKFMNSPDDGINIQADDAPNTGNHIWIDHCTFTNCYDGALDVTHGAEYVTLSWNHFFNHDKTCLLGHSNNQTTDTQLKVTYHHNYFNGTTQRHPRVRFGKAHVFNNYYVNNGIYGISSNLEADVLVEGNYFMNIPIPTETSRDGSPPGDLVERFNVFAGTTGTPGTRGTAFEASSYYSYTLDPAADVPTLVSTYAGSGKFDFSENPVPIQLASFTGRMTSGGVMLEWTTISEVNNFGFYVQRRQASDPYFSEFPDNFVAGHGTTNEPRFYQFTDASVTGGSWFYRLRQVDLDGTQHFTEPIAVSGVTSVEGTVPHVFRLSQNYPNPFNPETRITFSVAASGPATLTLHNLLGQTVATLFHETAEAGREYQVRFSGSHLASGIYFYRLHSGQQSAVRKLILLK
ncbi:MAG: T9SS type A sorting domain-containing protein [Bacteroidetes bacterium]|nr:T9SS type A sorting domain-containing protein [Bacteroidota bacterium]